jgi:hypothetical protein
MRPGSHSCGERKKLNAEVAISLSIRSCQACLLYFHYIYIYGVYGVYSQKLNQYKTES